MSANRVILSLVLATLLLVACGKKGPLYNPGQKSPEQTEQPQQGAQPEQDLPPTAPGY